MDCAQDLIDSGNWTHPQDIFVILNQPEPRANLGEIVFTVSPKPSSSRQHRAPGFGPTVRLCDCVVQAFPATDCNPGRELGNCSTYLPPPYTRTECEAACRNNPLCAGFNLPNGHLKTVDCDQDVHTPSSQDLYLIEGASPTAKQLP